MGCGASTQVAPEPDAKPRPSPAPGAAPPAGQQQEQPARGAAAAGAAAPAAGDSAAAARSSDASEATRSNLAFGSAVTTRTTPNGSSALPTPAASRPETGGAPPPPAPGSAGGGEPTSVVPSPPSLLKPSLSESLEDPVASAVAADAAVAAAVAAGEAAAAAAAKEAAAALASPAVVAADAAFLASLPAVVARGITLRGLRKLWAKAKALFEAGEMSKPVGEGLQGVDSLDAVTPVHLLHVTVGLAAGGKGGRLADMADLVDKADLGRPTYYVSHSSGCSLRVLIDTVEAYLASGSVEGGEDVRVWLDWVAVEQGAAAGDATAGAQALATVSQVLATCTGGTIVVADVRKSNPATRAWCLYEWSQTLQLHGPEALLTHSFNMEELDDVAAALTPTAVEFAAGRKLVDREAVRRELAHRFGKEEAASKDLKLQLLLRPLRLAPYIEHLYKRSSPEPWKESLAPVAQWLGQQLGTRWTSRALCIMGAAGTGKSCIAAAACTHLLGWQPSGSTDTWQVPRQVAPGAPTPPPYPASAALFLQRGDARTLDAVAMVQSIAYQLAQGLPALRDHLLSLAPSATSRLASIEDAFELLLAPVRMLHDHVVIVIDGLDEAEGGSFGQQQKSAKARGNPAVSLLLSCLVTRLPANVRFLLTTRPEAASGTIRSALERTALPNVGFMGAWQIRHGAPTPENPPPPAEGAPELLVAASVVAPEGADRVMLFDALVNECSLELPPPGTPDLRAVHWVYKAIFDVAAKAEAPKKEALLQILVAAQEPLSEPMLRSMGFSDALPSLPGWGVLFQLVAGRVQMVHSTLGEWLTDLGPDGSGAHTVDVGAGHAALGRHLLRHVLKAGGEVGGDKKPAQGTEEAGKEQQEEWEMADAAAMVAMVPHYAAKYAVLHLCRACAAAGGDRGPLDSALAQWEFLRQVFKQGHGARGLSALGELDKRSKYADDAFRWMRLCFREFTSSPENMETITLKDCPYSASIKYREAAHRLKAWFTACSLGGHHAGDWPADLAILKGHTAPVTSVVFSPDGRQVATGSEDATARVWDMATGQCNTVLLGHTAPVFTLQFSPDGQWLASGSSDFSAHLWDLVSGQATAKMMHTHIVHGVAFSPDGKQIATASADQTVGIWDRSRTVGAGKASEHCMKVLSGDMGCVYSVSYSPDGKQLITGCVNSVRVWDTSSWSMAAVILIQVQFGSDKVPSIAVHPDGVHIATGCLGSARVYNRQSAQCIATVETRGAHAGMSDAVAAYAIVALNPDGRQLAVAAENLEHTTRVWDWSNGNCVAELALARVRSLVFSPDGNTIVTGNADNTARVWDLSSRQCLPRGKAFSEIGSTFSMSPDGSKLASIVVNKQQGKSIVYVWDLMSWQSLAVLEGHNVLHPGPTGRYLEAVFSPNGRYVCTHASNDATAWVWDLAKRKCIAMMAGHNRGVSSVCFSSDSTRLVTGSRGNMARVWEVKPSDSIQTGQPLFSLDASKGDAPDEILMTAYPRLEGPDSGEVYSVAMSSNKRYVALGGQDCVRVMDCDGKRCIAMFKTVDKGNITCMAFSGDATMLAAGSQWDATARVWDIASGQCTAELKGHRVTSVYSIAFSPDGSKVVTGTGLNVLRLGEMQGPDGQPLTSSSFPKSVVNTARIWDVTTGAMWPASTAVLEGHTAEIVHITFSADGKKIVTSSSDQTARVWELADGQLTRTVVNPQVFKMQAVKRLQLSGE